jgi:hypothetical protein
MPKRFAYGPEASEAPPLPPPEGPLTEIITRTIVRHPTDHRDRSLLESATRIVAAGVDEPLDNLDLQLALDLCYELHYQSFRGVDPEWEWDPQLLEIRFQLETVLVGALSAKASLPPDPSGTTVTEQLDATVVPESIDRLNRFVALDCDLPQLRELLIHRSSERLRRSDAFFWSIPRLQGDARDALVEIAQNEEPLRAQLIAGMRSLGLDSRAGAYRDLLPATTLAVLNLSSLFGLRRQGRGAMAGQLAMQQTVGARDDRACARAVARLGPDANGSSFWVDSPGMATEVRRLVSHLATDEPALAESILFGARAFLLTQAACADWILERWQLNQSSLIEESLGFGGSGQG